AAEEGPFVEEAVVDRDVEALAGLREEAVHARLAEAHRGLLSFGGGLRDSGSGIAGPPAAIRDSHFGIRLKVPTRVAGRPSWSRARGRPGRPGGRGRGTAGPASPRAGRRGRRRRTRPRPP